MHWYVSGPSFVMIWAAGTILRSLEVVRPESRTRVLVGVAITFVAAVGLIVLDLVR